MNLFGETAIVRGRTTASGTLNGAPVSARIRFTDVFIKRNGRWVAVASHASPVDRKEQPHDDVGPGLVAVAQAAPRVRRLFWASDLPIAARLLPDDEVVVVKVGGDVDLITPRKLLTVKQVIADAAVRADLVAVIDVDVVDTMLSLGDSWVITRLTGTVRDLLRVREAGHFRLGQRLEAYIGGGEIRLGQVLVKAGDPIHPTASRSYFLFLENQDGVLNMIHPPLVIKDGKLEYLSPVNADKEPPNPMQGLTVDALGKMVREARTSWLCGKCRR